MCENVKLTDIANLCGQSPFYLTSKNQIIENFKAYKDAVQPNSIIAYKVDQTCNLNVLQLLASMGSGATVSSIAELEMALYAGIPAGMIIFKK